MDKNEKIDLMLARRLIDAEMTITALKEVLADSEAVNLVEIEARIGMVRGRDYKRLQDEILGPIDELNRVDRENREYNESFDERKTDPNKPW